VETLDFMHNTLKQAHLAVSLESIYVTPEGKWKLGGFGHNQALTSEGLIGNP
jgi:SCY1-like protein 2